MVSLRNNIQLTHLVIAGHFAALLLFVVTCNSIKSEDKLSGIVHPSGQEFAGSETCVECHRTISESHVETPHFLTSSLGSLETVKGSFDSAENVFVLNDRLKVTMEATTTGLFQRAFVDGSEVDKKPMDITIGSGRQGQTYLFWQDNSLFQLPVSYHAPSDSWSNSPGYPTDQIVFDRSISARCLECHSTHFKIGRSRGDLETFDKEHAILGVDCERCHGPAAQHVIFHRNNPNENNAQRIINPAQLTRKQKLDNCALCHAGIRNNILPSFTYVVGENLDNYSFPSTSGDSSATLDVHGNQFGLLTLSKCFKMSELDCSSCHDVHKKETKKLEVFSARCMHCHQPETGNFCTQPAAPGLVLANNCIDCHMPALPSRQVFLTSSGNKSTPFFVRTHLVGIYKKQVEKFLKTLEGNGVPEHTDQ